MTTVIEANPTHPLDAYLRTERLPSIWCPGCGLGLILNALLRALLKSGSACTTVLRVEPAEGSGV